MGKLGYFFNRLVRIDRERFRRTFDQLRQLTGKSAPGLTLDLLVCALRYNAGYMDYKIARMDRLNHAQRRTVITRGISNELVRRLNNRQHWLYFDDKCLFNERFARWVQRAWLRCDAGLDQAELAAFCAGKGPLFIKPLTGSSGVGIERVEPEAFQDIPAFYQRLKDKGECILEETVIQHQDMAALYPGSVNTVRIATILGEKDEGIVYAFVRIGNGRVMDNIDAGGMAARVDLDSGRINTVAADKQGQEFSRHPLTDAPITGFQLPCFEEAKQLCLQAMRVVPQVRYVAWDVALTPEGPRLIEGNSFPSHAVPQFAAHYPDGIGILPDFRRFTAI
ncbi:MAG: hypothetical protein GXY84_05160 [Clostridiales bacterium]|nr:hypothetical protein [Clostridiales bacterium]